MFLFIEIKWILIMVLQSENLFFWPMLDIYLPYSQSGLVKKEQISLAGRKGGKSQTERENKEQMVHGTETELYLVL